MSPGRSGGSEGPDPLLDRLLDLSPAKREALLAGLGDPARASRLRGILAAEAAGFLEGGAGGLAPGLLGEEVHDLPGPAAGTRVGGYRILRHLGSGGMGSVHLAEREEGDFRRQVALKMIRGGPGSEGLYRRFLQERRILAALEHPHVARLYDVGVSERGDPFFVMEYVPGIPIDRYCNEKGLTVEERLALFDQVCDAVDHAHRQLVVHRDLKPGNVLVMGDGVVKLLDFGVAKLVGGAAGEDGPATRVGAAPFTPEYASPEQILGEPVSTACDVWALGVLLYELLVGRRPWVLLPGVSPGEVARDLRDRPPTRPSQALPAGVRSGRWSRRLAGDLDSIVLTALQAEPRDRYPSVAALRDDLRRHREGRPVRARAGSAGYRAGRFLRRHRAAVAVAGLVATLVVAGVAATLAQAREARRQAARAERVAGILTSLFEASDPDRSLGRPLTALELLERGTQQLLGDPGDDPMVQAELLEILARLQGSLGAYAAAGELAARAVELRRREGPEGRPALAAALGTRASALRNLAAFEEAESAAREALALEEALHPPGAPSRLQALSNLAGVLSARGRGEEAEPLYRAVLREEESRGDTAAVASTLSSLGVLRGDLHTAVTVADVNLAETLRILGRFPEADTLLASVVERRRRLLGEAHPDVALAMNNRGEVLREAGRLEEALRLHREALDIRRRALGDEHPDVAASLNNVAIVHYFRREREEAAEGFIEARDLFSRSLGPAHPHTVSAINNLAAVRREQGRLDEAEGAFRDLLARTAPPPGEDPSFSWVTALHNLGWTLLARERMDEAGKLFQEVVPHFRRLQGPHPNTGTALGGWGRTELELGRPATAEPLLREAVDILSSSLEPGSLRTADYRVWLGVSLARLGRRDEAREVLEAGLAPIRDQRGADDPVRRRGEAALAGLSAGGEVRRSGGEGPG